MNGRMLFPLFSFDFLFDTEIGLFEFIKRFCANPEAFDLDILNQDRDILRKLLDERENQNPLSVISTKENMKDIDLNIVLVCSLQCTFYYLLYCFLNRVKIFQ